MPTFTAIAFDRLLEPGSRIQSSKLPSTPVNLVRLTSDKKRFPLPQVSPALYATPATTSLPDSPSSFPPTPYIVNHKRRGPRLLNTLSQPPRLDAAKLEPEAAAGEGVLDGVHDEKFGVGVDDPGDGVVRAEESAELIGAANGEYLFDLQEEELSTVSNAHERLLNPTTPMGEFFDALEGIDVSKCGSVDPHLHCNEKSRRIGVFSWALEISGDGVTQSSQDIDDEMCEMMLNVSIEIARRKHAEEALENLQNRWKELSHQLSLVGFSLPAPLITIEETNDHSNPDPAEELCKQIVIARSVATAIEKGCSRAEVELEMESQIESKNFEIARLSDRLQYYEAANREMSQRNQEAVEMARQHRFRQKRRHKWFCATIGLTISIGAAALARSYLPCSEPISSHEVLQAQPAMSSSCDQIISNST